MIRNSSTKQFKAIENIQAHIRWCLSGTPVQNKLDDLGSLVRFLRLPLLDDPNTFRKHIIGDAKSLRELLDYNYENLSALLGSICLRRSKAVLDLQGLKTEVCRLDFTETERVEYRRLGGVLKQTFDASRNGKKTKKQFRNVLEAWLQLRLFCNHGLTYAQTSHHTEEEILSLSQQIG